MTCEDLLPALDEYVDGELDAQTVRRADAHMAVCPSCAEVYAMLSREQEILSSYNRKIHIRPSLWEGVRAGIEKEKLQSASQTQKERHDWFASMFARLSLTPTYTIAALAVAIAVILIYQEGRKEVAAPPADSLVVQSLNAGENRMHADVPRNEAASGTSRRGSQISDFESRREPLVPGSSRSDKLRRNVTTSARNNLARRIDARPSHAVARSYVTGSPVIEAEREYLQAIAILSRDSLAGRAQFDSATLAPFDEALSTIDRAIEETRQAVREKPDDVVAVRYMLTAYAKKIEVLKDLAGLKMRGGT